MRGRTRRVGKARTKAAYAHRFRADRVGTARKHAPLPTLRVLFVPAYNDRLTAIGAAARRGGA